MRIAAVLVRAALLGGAARGWLAARGEHSAPAIEQAAGWVAADVETFVARDSTGSRVLVVRGNLFPDGAAPPPDVEVSLLETDGARVGEPRRAWLQRLDDAEIAPERLALRLASSAGELSGTGPQVTGFTALLPDPPARARRISIELSAGKAAQPARDRGESASRRARAAPRAEPAPAPAAPAPEAPSAPPTATAREASRSLRRRSRARLRRSRPPVIAREASPKPPAPIARPEAAPAPKRSPAAPAPE